MKSIFSKAVMFVVVAGVVTPMCAIDFVKLAKSFGSALQTKVAGFRTSAVEFGTRAKDVVSAQRTRVADFASTQKNNAVKSFGAKKEQGMKFYSEKISPRFASIKMPKLPKVQMPSTKAMAIGGVVVPAAAFGGLYGYGAYLVKNNK